jgi:hypothetical protein
MASAFLQKKTGVIADLIQPTPLQPLFRPLGQKDGTVQVNN